MYKYCQYFLWWLNEVYKNDWLDIGFANNAQTMVKWINEKLWSEYENKISIAQVLLSPCKTTYAWPIGLSSIIIVF